MVTLFFPLLLGGATWSGSTGLPGTESRADRRVALDGAEVSETGSVVCSRALTGGSSFRPRLDREARTRVDDPGAVADVVDGSMGEAGVVGTLCTVADVGVADTCCDVL